MSLTDGIRPPVRADTAEPGDLPDTVSPADVAAKAGEISPAIVPIAAPVAVFDAAIQEKLPEAIKGQNIVELGSEVARVAAMGDALHDDRLREDIKRGQAKVLRADTDADVLQSKIKVQQHKADSENILYNRYRYVFNMLGITQQIPSFMCIVVLLIYAIAGTILSVTFGTLFLITNYIVEGVRGVFERLSALFGATSGLAKGLALTSVFVLILGLVAAVVFVVLKYTIL